MYTITISHIVAFCATTPTRAQIQNVKFLHSVAWNYFSWTFINYAVDHYVWSRLIL